VTLSGASTFTGGLTINNGTIQLNNAAALNSTAPNAVTINGGASGATQPRLQLNGISVTVGGLNSTGGASATPAIVENSGATPATLTVKLGSNPTFDGILRNGAATLSLATSGSGKITLTGVNTYTGSTTAGAGGNAGKGANLPAR
jgi:autotransporter-associated beta strand protein